jgi:hypothetical protein
MDILASNSWLHLQTGRYSERSWTDPNTSNTPKPSQWLQMNTSYTEVRFQLGFFHGMDCMDNKQTALYKQFLYGDCMPLSNLVTWVLGEDSDDISKNLEDLTGFFLK